MNDTLKKFAELKVAIKELETEADALKLEVLSYMQDKGIEEVEVSDIGKIVTKSRRSWRYTPETVAMEDKLKEQKTLEERLGTAQSVENVYVQFNAFKE